MRYRELRWSDVDRAREVVAAWRDAHPTGTAEQLIADVGWEFHRDWGLVLRSQLYVEDRHRARRTTGVITDERGGIR